MGLDSDLKTIKSLWAEKITLASKKKWHEFGKYAVECEKFYAAPNHNFMYKNEFNVGDGPKVTTNLVFQMVDVFLPFLHHTNPNRLVTDRRPQVDPMLQLALYPPEMIQQAAQEHDQQQIQMAQQAGVMGQPFQPQQFDPTVLLPSDPVGDATRLIRHSLMEQYLNYTPHELALHSESLKSLTEALVMGRGVWWTELIDGPNGKMVGSFHDSVDFLQLDPDFTDLKKCAWASRERTAPRAWLERRFGMPKDDLKGSSRSHTQQAAENVKGEIAIEGIAERQRDKRSDDDGSTQDLVRYFEIYSRCGLGGKLAGAEPELQDRLASFGDNLYIVITDDYPYPLNMRPDMFDVGIGGDMDGAIRSSRDGMQWPTPMHADPAHPWPFTVCDFHHQRNSVWPVSHVRPALGEQKIINWIWSHVANQVSQSSDGTWLYDERLPDEIIEKLTRRVNNKWVGLPNREGRSLRELVDYLPPPDVSQSLMEVAQIFEHRFQTITGSLEVLGGGQSNRQMRSSAEAQIANTRATSRPEAMAERYDQCQSRIARNEAIAIRHHLDAKQIAPFFEEDFSTDSEQELPEVGYLSQLWQHAVFSDDINKILSESNYRIESGSSRKPNPADISAALNEQLNQVMPLLKEEWQATGDPTNINKYMAHLAKANPGQATIELTDLRALLAEQQAQQQQPPQQQLV